MTGAQKESPPTMWDAHSGRANIFFWVILDYVQYNLLCQVLQYQNCKSEDNLHIRILQQVLKLLIICSLCNQCCRFIIVASCINHYSFIAP